MTMLHDHYVSLMVRMGQNDPEWVITRRKWVKILGCLNLDKMGVK
jgi:hypothetical protein